ncbi:MAG: myxococcus cysteine-rich repeat containing protein, partial [Deltaproteobacteria bacterium]
MKVGPLGSLLAAITLAAGPATAQVCGDGAIDPSEGCDDGNTTPQDGCDASCVVEPGYTCVPSLHASGVNPAGVNLPSGSTDPHWVWSLSANRTNPTPGYVDRYPAWGSLPPGNWVTNDATFGQSITSQAETFWFQDVYMPAAFAGTLTFDVAVAADNAAEVFVNGTSYGSMVGFGAATSIPVPSSAFVAGANVVMIRLVEYIPGTPRGILMYPGGGGILSQCALGCATAPDCDDGNPCTVDSCLAGACLTEVEPLGTTCTSTGICSHADPIPFCVGCVDLYTVTSTIPDLGCDLPAPFCDESGASPLCVACIDTSTTGTSTVPDVGCDGTLPFCNEASGSPLCVECEDDMHCPGGAVCLGGTCGMAPLPDAGVVDAGFVDAGSRDAALPHDGGPPR